MSMQNTHAPPDRQNRQIKTWRKQLDDNLDSLTAAFRAGTAVDEIVRARAGAVDAVLTEIWETHFGDCPDEAALVAVGGYGRGELHPHSDVDLMILLQDGALDKHRARVESIITLLWDLKLEIGHSVRTCGECASEATKDITVVTNLMEARLLAGSGELFSRMQTETAESKIWSKKDFFKAKMAEQVERHSKFDETAYRLEPNIKEGPGGLRDIQTIFWVAKRYFKAARLEDLTDLGFLTRDELEALLAGREMLWRIRYALHTVAGRREDRLLFDYQRELADEFGFHSDKHNLAVEQFMQQYYRTVTELERLNEMLLQLLRDAIEYPDDQYEPIVISKRFEAIHGYLQIRHPKVFSEYPPALLEVFLVLQQNPELKGVRAQTIRAIRNHRYLIDHKFRDDVINRDTFMAILREPYGVSHELRRMNRYGVLAAYLPEFANIVGRMQYDLFHIYTVDLHTLFVLRNVRRFSVPEHADWEPTCTKIFPTLDRPEILYIAALFHDIAKGRGGDHSELGAEDAERFCLKHGLGRDHTSLVVWLVRNHLLMSMTSQRKDISDPAVINEFALKVGDLKTLNHLYLLTVADISATNPELMSSWRSRLLLELYLRTKHVFRHGLAKPIDAKTRIRERLLDAEQILGKASVPAATCRKIWTDFGDDYFLRHNSEEIAWHTYAIANSRPESLPLVVINEKVTRGTTPIFIYAKGNDGFFAIVTAALTRLGLNIVDARIIMSKSGYTLDTYLVLDDQNEPIRDLQRIEDIHRLISEGIRQSDDIPEPPPRPVPRQLKHFDTPTKITTEKSADGRHTLIEVIAGDRPGLLATIARTLFEEGVRVHDAKISTIGENAENIFLISEADNSPITSTGKLNHLVEVLRHSIDEAEDTKTGRQYAI